MREIRFRAWVKNYATETFEMIEWFPDFFSDTSPVTGYWGRFPNPNCQDVILMQSTGLHDKNGREIYEGDIVDARNECGGIHDVKWMPIEQGVGLGIDCSGCLAINHMEVIGNIYENPELMKISCSIFL